MPEVVLIIPGVPRAKRSLSGPQYEQRVKETARESISEPLRERGLSLDVHHFYTSGNFLDLDNLLQPIFDGLKDAAYQDDSQIDHVCATRYNIAAARVENPREEWIDWLEQATDFVSIVIQY